MTQGCIGDFNASTQENYDSIRNTLTKKIKFYSRNYLQMGISSSTATTSLSTSSSGSGRYVSANSNRREDTTPNSRPTENMTGGSNFHIMMRSMPTQTSIISSRPFLEYYSSTSSENQLRTSWSEQTQPLNSSEEIDTTGSKTASSSASITPTERGTFTFRIEPPEIGFNDRMHSSTTLIIDQYPVFGDGFSPEKLVGLEINLTSLGAGTVIKFISMHEEKYHYLVQMRDGRKVVVPFSAQGFQQGQEYGSIIGRIF